MPRLFVISTIVFCCTACGSGSDQSQGSATQLAVEVQRVEPAPPIIQSLGQPPLSLPPASGAVAMLPLTPAQPPRPRPGNGGGRAATVEAGQAASASLPPPPLRRTVLAQGLASPQDLAFTPEGLLLYVERARGLSALRPDGSRALLFAPDDLVGTAPYGMFGVAVDPDFFATRAVYVFMTSGRGPAVDHRVVRIALDETLRRVIDRQDLLTGIEAQHREPSAGSREDGHVGGRLRFGKDGSLYVAIGDMLNAAAPQAADMLAGKVLRVEVRRPQGQLAAAAGPGRQQVFAVGLRNPQGLVVQPDTGELWVSEAGAGRDELTRVVAGGNGGWDPRCPEAPRAYCGIADPKTKRPLAAMTDLGKYPKAMTPSWTNLNRAQGMAGATILRGIQWKHWDGGMVVTYMGAPRVDVLRLDSDGAVSALPSLLEGLAVNFRAAAQGPDGDLYLLTHGMSRGDQLWRITPL